MSLRDLEAAFCKGLRVFEEDEKFLKKNLEKRKKAFYFAAAKPKNVLSQIEGMVFETLQKRKHVREKAS